MIRLEEMTGAHLARCACVYRDAYAGAPWNESYEAQEIERYLGEFLKGGAYRAYVLTKGGECVALALCVLVPGVGCPSLRIEDFCVAPSFQGKGYGSTFLRLLKAEAAKKRADCLLLGTQRGFPSQAFYLKNGFEQIDTSVLMYCEVQADGNRQS